MNHQFDLAWFVIEKGICCLFTCSRTRKGAWDRLLALYKDRPETLKHVRRQRQRGEIRVVKAAITWRT